MAKKTVLKLLLSKYAPLSVEMQNAIKSDQAVIDERGEAHYVDRDEYTSVEDVTNKVAHEIESKTASEPLDFDGETGEIYEPPTATPTTPTDTEAKLEGKPKAAQVEAPF